MSFAGADLNGLKARLAQDQNVTIELDRWYDIETLRNAGYDVVKLLGILQKYRTNIIVEGVFGSHTQNSRFLTNIHFIKEWDDRFFEVKKRFGISYSYGSSPKNYSTQVPSRDEKEYVRITTLSDGYKASLFEGLSSILIPSDARLQKDFNSYKVFVAKRQENSLALVKERQYKFTAYGRRELVQDIEWSPTVYQNWEYTEDPTVEKIANLLSGYTVPKHGKAGPRTLALKEKLRARAQKVETTQAKKATERKKVERRL